MEHQIFVTRLAQVQYTTVVSLIKQVLCLYLDLDNKNTVSCRIETWLTAVSCKLLPFCRLLLQ